MGPLAACVYGADKALPLYDIYIHLSTRLSLNAVMLPCTGCYIPILLTLYGGLAAAMR